MVHLPKLNPLRLPPAHIQDHLTLRTTRLVSVADNPRVAGNTHSKYRYTPYRMQQNYPRERCWQLPRSTRCNRKGRPAPTRALQSNRTARDDWKIVAYRPVLFLCPTTVGGSAGRSLQIGKELPSGRWVRAWNGSVVLLMGH